ncbi:MAG: hypothetical protein F9K19_00555 [Rhizobiaceae bacterium]|nr:MAG: hypothetical protein F9K19_00555 [Rhizobiaceae bacterium]CAG0952690.1 hypothetical protein RHIZO_00275 [Rhizobiaceae bacterium]
MQDDKTDRTKDDRKARLAEQLRQNLQRRKAQTRARRAGDADSRPEGIGGQEAAATEDGGRARDD